MATAREPSLAERILAHLRARPGQKAAEIARALGVEREAVNKALYGPLNGRVVQDRGYRWSLASARASAPPEEEPERYANTDLSKLCRYYLACLGFDDTGVSTFLTSKYGDPDFLELRTLPRGPFDLAETEAARRMLGRKRTERGRYGLYLGYPTALNRLRSKRSDWEGWMVEPIFLFPIEQENGRLRIDLGFPIVNQKPLERFTNAERDQLMTELVQLERELGLDAEGEPPEIDELALRLQAVRPEWPWREEIDPDELGIVRGRLADVAAQGIFNRAIIIMAEKSPYTQGLEQELRELAKLPESAYAHTALGQWLRGPIEPSDAPPPTDPLIEVLPMNSEQRQAVAAALSRPMTVITGPPGTGKSQVVTNLLVNAAWRDKRILFASKNNKAVDVVETRVNALGSRPILLRVGARAYQVHLAEYVLALLSATASPGERQEFEEAKRIHQDLVAHHQQLEAEAGQLVELRNRVDLLDRGTEPARQLLGPDLFARAESIDTDPLRNAIASVDSAVDFADRARAPFLTRLFWPFVRKGRLQALGDACDAVRGRFAEIGIGNLPERPAEGDLEVARQCLREAEKRLPFLDSAGEYWTALRDLQAHRSLEEISADEAKTQQRIADHSVHMWKLWICVQPSKLSPEQRRRLGQYEALLKMVIEAGPDAELPEELRRQYAKLLREVSHLLPCWAVTNLSARGKVPFEPGNFDLVVFDEASQCDIASALPLLYRAKAVAVIGDPKQLSHISGLQRGQDQKLLEKFGLVEDFPHWSYGQQSLFGLAALQVTGEAIVGLVDHHRSHGDIINFSNAEFYEERLRVATRYDRLKRPAPHEPGIRWIDVKGTCRRPPTGGAVNTPEVKAVVDVLGDLVLTKGYGGSVGVVTPFRAQANAITEAVNGDEKLVDRLIEQGFLADTVHKLQGDERDLMIFSPVVAQGAPAGAVGFLKANGNLFNVAITRARAQLLVVGDRSACARSDIGYLSRFAAYVADLASAQEQDEADRVADLGPEFPTVANPERVSDWERIFYRALYASGIRPIPQYVIEKFVVDFLVINGDRRLVIEVDGERYHRNWTGELCRRDQLRNQRMFELGYDVTRFWVPEIRDDIHACVAKVRSWLRA
jgi:very-short-patch-repair endonuclease